MLDYLALRYPTSKFHIAMLKWITNDSLLVLCKNSKEQKRTPSVQCVSGHQCGLCLAIIFCCYLLLLTTI